MSIPTTGEILTPVASESGPISTNWRDTRVRFDRFVFNNTGEPEISVTLLPQITLPDGSESPSWRPINIVNEGVAMPGVPAYTPTLLDTLCVAIMDAAFDRSKLDPSFDASEILKASLAIKYAG